jgi:hypothetical protein
VAIHIQPFNGLLARWRVAHSQSSRVHNGTFVCRRSPSFNLAGQTKVWTPNAQTKVFEAIFKIKEKSLT